MLSPTHFCPTKKAFKGAIASGKDIFFSDPSIIDSMEGYLSDLPEEKTFYVVGPTQYNRKWYAQLRKTRDGLVKVS